MKSRTLLSEREEEIASIIVNCAYRVHKALGPGLLEKAYESCFVYELGKAGLKTERQVPVFINYDDQVMDEGFRADVLVEGRVICELKSVAEMHPIFEAQMISHLKLSEVNLGFLINFNVRLIKDGIQRFVL
jgi:GxxExxY protein